jgi:copper chaperone CopZ
LAENTAGAALVRQKLPTIPGVQSVELRPATGSVLIAYRQEEVRPELLFAAVVRLLNLDAEFKRMPQPIVTRELKEILGSANRMVYDRTGGLIDLWSAGLILLAAIGIRRLVVDGMRATPAGLTLVWWGLASLGFYLYKKNEAQVDDWLRRQSISFPLGGARAKDPSSRSLEELLREKERLEDLIAERELAEKSQAQAAPA